MSCKVLYEDQDTQNAVFLLSREELSGLDQSVLLCKPTTYALNKGAKVFGSGCCGWWLRSIGSGQRLVNFVMQTGEISEYMTAAEGRCVRPAIWIQTGE